LFQYQNEIIPVEVKAKENSKSKSVKVYHEKYTPKTVIRTSMSPFRKETWLTNLPLYGISGLLY